MILLFKYLLIRTRALGTQIFPHVDGFSSNSKKLVVVNENPGRV